MSLSHTTAPCPSMVGTGLLPGTRCRTLKLVLVGKTTLARLCYLFLCRMAKHREAFSFPLCYFFPCEGFRYQTIYTVFLQCDGILWLADLDPLDVSVN